MIYEGQPADLRADGTSIELMPVVARTPAEELVTRVGNRSESDGGPGLTRERLTGVVHNTAEHADRTAAARSDHQKHSSVRRRQVSGDAGRWSLPFGLRAGDLVSVLTLASIADLVVPRVARRVRGAHAPESDDHTQQGAQGNQPPAHLGRTYHLIKTRPIEQGSRTAAIAFV